MMDDEYAVIVRRSDPMAMSDAWRACVAGVARLMKSKPVMTLGFLPKLEPDESLGVFTEELPPIEVMEEWTAITLFTTQRGSLNSETILQHYHELNDIWDDSSMCTRECRVVMSDSKHFAFPHQVLCRQDVLAFRILGDLPGKKRFDAFGKFFKLIGKRDLVDLQWDGTSVSIGDEEKFGQDESGELIGVRIFTNEDMNSNLKRFKLLLGTRADQAFFKLEAFDIDSYLRGRERLNEMFRGWTTEIMGEPGKAFKQWWKTGKGAPSGRLPILFLSRKMSEEIMADVSVSIAPNGKSYSIELGGPESSKAAIDACAKAFDRVTFQ